MIKSPPHPKPFSHKIGIICLIPGTNLSVQAFPTLLRFRDLATHASWEEKLPWRGPVENFTVEMHPNHIAIFGRTPDGFRRHLIQGEKAKKKLESLSLGKHTKLDWELVFRRLDMQEITPILFWLGQITPPQEAQTPILDLLHFADKRDVAPQLKNFFRTGFSNLLLPRLTDTDFQGIIPNRETSGSPLALLSHAYRAIRSLFFREDGSSLFLLPLLPPEFHAGKLLHLQTTQGDDISLLFSKKLLKIVEIHPAQNRAIHLHLQKPLTSFRVNRRHRVLAKDPLQLEAGRHLFLDRFEK